MRNREFRSKKRSGFLKTSPGTGVEKVMRKLEPCIEHREKGEMFGVTLFINLRWGVATNYGTGKEQRLVLHTLDWEDPG